MLPICTRGIGFVATKYAMNRWKMEGPFQSYIRQSLLSGSSACTSRCGLVLNEFTPKWFARIMYCVRLIKMWTVSAPFSTALGNDAQSPRQANIRGKVAETQGQPKAILAQVAAIRSGKTNRSAPWSDLHRHHPIDYLRLPLETFLTPERQLVIMLSRR